MHPAIYFPTHQSKLGEMIGTGHLSPLARTRTRPTFNITRPGPDNEDPIEYHLSDLAQKFAKVWGGSFPVFFDLPRYAPEHKVRDGRHPVEYFFDCARQCRLLGIPVAGPESVRGPGFGYIEAVARVAHRDGRGAGVRIPYRDFSKPETLDLVIEETTRSLALSPELIDVFLDFEALILLPYAEQSEEHLLAVATDAFRVISGRAFRNVVLCGSSIPDQVGKFYNWNPLRIPRKLLRIWQILAEREATPPKFGDSGVVYAHERDGGKSGPPPSRIRLSTNTEYILCRAPRGNYRRLSSQIVKSTDFDPAMQAWAISELAACAKGSGSEGNPTTWVARDTNLHDEMTARFVERVLRQYRRLDGVTFADPEHYAWLQTNLDISSSN